MTGVAPQRRSRSASRTRERLLEAAQELFGKQGFERTTLREVAGRAGVDAALVARYFGGKEQLYLAALRAEVGHDRPADLTEPERVAELVERVARRGSGPVLGSVLRRPDDDAVAAEVAAHLDARLVAPLRDRLADAGRADADLRAEVMVAALLGVLAAREAGTLPRLAELDDATAAALVSDLFAMARGTAEGSGGGTAGRRVPRRSPATLSRPVPEPSTYGGGMARPTRWATETGAEHSQWYIERFRTMAAEGADLAGEARLVDAMLPRGSRVLDAGCGTGRVGAELHARGHVVVGVDADPELVAAAAHDHPGPTWLVCDLAELDLPALGHEEPFDAAVVAGNVLAFVAPDTERAVLRSIVDHLRPDGFCAVGFGTGRGYDLARFDEDLEAAGFTLEHRFATWDLRPWHDGAEFAVSLLRRPAGAGAPRAAAQGESRDAR